MQSPRIADGLRSIAANIRRLRLRRGLTQEALGEAARIASRYIQIVESGKGNPSASALIAIADALGVSPGALFKPALPQDRRPGRPKAKSASSTRP